MIKKAKVKRQKETEGGNRFDRGSTEKEIL
jgi:hypothetical protein